GFVQQGEQCDDGNLLNDDSCASDCTIIVGCENGTSIIRPYVKISGLDRGPGRQSITFSGSMVFPPTSPANFGPSETGIQILLEDGRGSDLFAVGIPPESAGTCGRHPRDGWHPSPSGTRSEFRSSSGSIDPPLCTPASSKGLTYGRLTDRRSKSGEIP